MASPWSQAKMAKLQLIHHRLKIEKDRGPELIWKVLYPSNTRQSTLLMLTQTTSWGSTLTRQRLGSRFRQILGLFRRRLGHPLKQWGTIRANLIYTGPPQSPLIVMEIDQERSATSVRLVSQTNPWLQEWWLTDPAPSVKDSNQQAITSRRRDKLTSVQQWPQI